MARIEVEKNMAYLKNGVMMHQSLPSDVLDFTWALKMAATVNAIAPMATEMKDQQRRGTPKDNVVTQ